MFDAWFTIMCLLAVVAGGISWLIPTKTETLPAPRKECRRG